MALSKQPPVQIPTGSPSNACPGCGKSGPPGARAGPPAGLALWTCPGSCCSCTCWQPWSSPASSCSSQSCHTCPGGWAWTLLPSATSRPSLACFSCWAGPCLAGSQTSAGRGQRSRSPSWRPQRSTCSWLPPAARPCPACPYSLPRACPAPSCTRCQVGPAAQMAITDLSAPEERPAALGRLGLCFGVGVIFGSLLGGTLSSTCGIQCPVIVAFVVSLLGAVLSLTCIPTSTKGASARAQAALPGKPKASVFDLKAITCLLLQPGVLPVFLVKVICGFPSAVAWGGPARDNLGEGSRWSSLSRSPRPSPWHRDGHLTGGAGVGTTAQPRPLNPDPPPRPGLFMVMFSLISMDFFQLEAAQAGYLMSFFGVLQMAARSGPSCSAGVGPPRHRAQPRPDPSPRGCCSKPTAPRALPVCLVEVAGDQVFQGLVIGWLSSRFSEGALLRASVLAFSVVGLAMALMANVFHLCLLMPGLVFSLCALNVVTDSMLTNAVSASDTGTMLGLCASVQPLTRTLGPTLGGLLYHRFGVPVFGHVQLAVNFLVLLVLWRQPVPPKMDKAW
ncbi:solute carrier family 22 member 18 isoform X4 [Tursiops truncatus]|uniref:Solute carrier family 22 member 18 isoform X4 n=1 Tax=Tursiops truncatus TaxID=9739 RepID=A0A6J3RRH7_TURTR|nr:solute carrier family 22 member 18 isoform X4 [Tursiops truncatus]